MGWGLTVPRGGPKHGRSLADLYPAQAVEWHPALNDGLKPTDVSPGNNGKVWWMCGRCGSPWQASINNRTVKHSINCVECNRGRKRRIQDQAQDAPPDAVATSAPALATEWHPEKNGPLTPESTPIAWDQNIWWRCAQCANEWPLPPRFRAGDGDRGCPECAASAQPPTEALPPYELSLAHTNPGVAREWHPSSNIGHDPEAFTPDSPHEVWWLCLNPDCRHKWFAAINTRTVGKRRGCPVCSRPRSEIPPPGESVADLHPDVIPEWHPTLNGSLDPHTVKPQSGKKVWWLCASCGYVWQATVANRTTGGTGCAPCSYTERIAIRDQPAPGKSFADLFPHLLSEWHPTRNDRQPGELKPGSDIKAWWVCVRGHLWQARLYTRTGVDKTGCPECRDLPADGQSLADQFPDLALQWHDNLNEGRQPREFSTGSAHLAWWQCPVGHVWQARIVNRAKPDGSGCTQCRTWGTSQQQIRLAHELVAAGCAVVHNHDRIPVQGRTPVNADIVIPDYQTVIEFDGSHYHLGDDAATRDLRQTEALEGAGWRVIRVRPAPLAPLRPEDILLADGRDTKAATIAVLQRLEQLGFKPVRANNYCADPALWAIARADEEIQARFARSLSTLFPEVAADWHPTLNRDRRAEFTNPGSRDRAWWQCSSCGHEWETSPKKRTTDQSGCPVCARSQAAATHRTPKPGRSLADMKPELLAIFHPTKNGDISLWDLNFGTTIELSWLCPRCGDEWTTRTPRNTGCRQCKSDERGKQTSTPKPGESLQDLHPMIASQWHPTKNGDLLPSHVREIAAKAVWWLCGDCGREWRRSPRARVVTGSGCRRCSAGQVGLTRRRPQPGDSLAETHPHLAQEWIQERNPGLSPESLRSNSMERAWWLCSTCGNTWNARIDTRALRGHGCKKCAAAQLSITQRRPKPGCSLADVKPEALKLWHPRRNEGIRPQDLKPNTHTRVWWLCPNCGHEWEATPAQPGCRPCGSRRSGIKQTKPAPGRSLPEKCPAIAQQWDFDRNSPVRPEDVGASSSQYFWWTCTYCDFQWRARPSTRITSVYLCPNCKDHRVNGS
jgi:hypothetical protein